MPPVRPRSTSGEVAPFAAIAAVGPPSKASEVTMRKKPCSPHGWPEHGEGGWVGEFGGGAQTISTRGGVACATRSCRCHACRNKRRCPPQLLRTIQKGTPSSSPQPTTDTMWLVRASAGRDRCTDEGDQSASTGSALAPSHHYSAGHLTTCTPPAAAFCLPCNPNATPLPHIQ